MNLNVDQVKKVAKLANLPLSADEEKKYAEQLSKVLNYIEELDQVDTSNTEPTYNVSPNQNVMREDVSQPSLLSDEALKNAADTKDGLFVTKGVFAEE